MSYILDAIRKSESEEEQGQIPTLHSQHAGVEPEPANLSYLRLLVPAFLALMVILSLVIWFATGGTPPAGPALAEPRTPPPADIARVRQVQLKPVTNPLTRDKVAQSPPVRQREQVPAAAFTDAEIVLAEAGSAAATAPEPGPASEAPPTSAASPPTDGADIFTLPVAEQRLLPDIDYSSHIYSESAGKSFVIMNGRLLNEGDFVDGHLRLIRIRENDVLLDLKGRRYSLKSLTDFSKP